MRQSTGGAHARPAAGAHARRGPRQSWRRLRQVLPALLVLGWLLAGAVAGPYAGRLAQVQTNDNTAFLPASAESTAVDEIAAGFADEAGLPAVVVVEYDRTVTAADLSAVGRAAGSPVPAVPSADGRAIQVVVPLASTDAEEVTAQVALIRARVADLRAPGVQVWTTGPAGVLADFGAAFGQIDGLLLLVAVAVVLVILIAVYRSPLLPVLVLLTALLALGAAAATVYALAAGGVLTLNGQSQGILFILVVGAATDYALLIVARFREELRDSPSRLTAVDRAVKGVLEPVVASGTTVVLGVLCLLLSDLNSNRGLGPVAAIGIAFAMLSALTFLPAVLAVLGRSAFWPFRPVFGSAHGDARGVWAWVADLVARRPRAVWVATAAALAAAAAFAPTFRAEGVAQTEFFLTPVESVAGQEALARHFPAGSGSPVQVVAPAAGQEAVTAVLEADPGVAGVAAQGDAGPAVVGGRVLVNATLADAADSAAAEVTVRRLRADLDAVGSDVLVGGSTAVQLDVLETSRRDLRLIIPAVLLVILLVLAVLLRSLVAPAVLLAANVASFAATIGVAALLFNTVLDWPGADPAVPLYAFVFLVALGIDYSIFLMTRVREESLRRGTRAGIRKGLAVTGGVITSAGVVLAATFSALAVLPLLFLAQIAFLVGFGVLEDTLVVRSLLVPALAYDIGARVWWPSRLA